MSCPLTWTGMILSWQEEMAIYINGSHMHHSSVWCHIICEKQNTSLIVLKYCSFMKKMNSSFSTAFHCYYQFLLLVPFLYFQLVFQDKILFYINSAIVKKFTMPTILVPYILKLFLFIMLKINVISSYKKEFPNERVKFIHSHI